MDEIERPRARRHDAGQVRLTERDLAAFGWLADMKAIWEPDLAVLLGRLAGSEPVSAPAVRRMIVRWRRAGVAEGRKILADRPRLVFLAAGGAALVGETTWREAAAWTAYHAADVSRARLWLEGQARVEVEGLPAFAVADWTAERRWRQHLLALAGGKMAPGVHVPDGILTTPSGKRIAVEVERTPKEHARLDRIVGALTVPGGYDGVLYLVTGTAVESAVRGAYERTVERARGRVAPLGLLRLPEVLS